MSSMFDGIPHAVATIVSAVPKSTGAPNSEGDLDKIQKRVIELTDQLTRTFTKALREATK